MVTASDAEIRASILFWGPGESHRLGATNADQLGQLSGREVEDLNPLPDGFATTTSRAVELPSGTIRGRRVVYTVWSVFVPSGEWRAKWLQEIGPSIDAVVFSPDQGEWAARNLSFFEELRRYFEDLPIAVQNASAFLDKPDGLVELPAGDSVAALKWGGRASLQRLKS